MKKKVIFGVLILAAAAAAGFYGYWAYQKSRDFDWRDLAVLKIVKKDLPDYALDRYKEDFAGAKDRLNENPKDINAWLTVAMMRKSVGDYQGAADVWNYIADLYPQDATALGNLGDLYVNFMGKPEEAESMYKKALNINPENSGLIIGLAEVYRYHMPGKENLYELVILDGLKVLPDDINLISSLASYYRQTRQVQKGIEYYEKLLVLDPENQAAKEDLAELREKTN